MRAITVRQPWAWAIIHGGKDVENRTRNIAGKYRGPVAIHAGLRHDLEYDKQLIAAAVGRWARANPQVSHLDFPDDPPNARPLWYGHLGRVIGVADLVDVHWADPFEGCHRPDSSWECSAWADTGCYHLALRNRRPLPRPIPWRGRLGLWTVPDELEALIWEQVTA